MATIGTPSPAAPGATGSPQRWGVLARDARSGSLFGHLHARWSGARADRPAYVFHEFPVAPGEHRLEVHFAPAIESTLPPLDLDESVTLSPREILLVTHEPGAEGLSLRRGAP